MTKGIPLLSLAALLFGAVPARAVLDPAASRPAAMGDAYAAASGDVDVLHYNPAGLASLERSAVSLSVRPGIDDDATGTVDAAFLAGKSAWAAGVTYYDGGSLDLLDPAGRPFSIKARQDFLGTLAYARRLEQVTAPNWLFLRRVSVGLAIKAFRSTLVEDYTATAYALDAGVNYKRESWALGLAAQNLGPEMKYAREKEDLPRVYRAGLSWKKGPVAVHADALRLGGREHRAHMGVEWRPLESLALRLGNRSGYRGEQPLTLGLGLSMKAWKADYALKSLEAFGTIHTLTLSRGF